MLIRVAEAGDIEVVEALRYAALSTSAPSVYSPREVVELLDSLDVDELRAMVKDRQLFVAETDGRIVGCAGWRGKVLRHVYVTPDSERGGLGTRLGLSCRVRLPGPNVRGGTPCGLGSLPPGFLRAARFRASHQGTIGKRAVPHEEE